MQKLCYTISKNLKKRRTIVRALTKFFVSFFCLLGAVVFGMSGYLFLSKHLKPKEVLFLETQSSPVLTADEPAKTLVDSPKLLISSPFVYDGTERNVTELISGFDSEIMEYSENSQFSGTNAGTYVILVELKDATNYMWNDSLAGNTRYLTWTISKKSQEIPELDDERNYEYNKQEQQVQFKTTIDENLIQIGGDAKKINAGNYIVTLSLKDKTNYQWEDNTTDDKTFNWEIKQLKLNIPKLKQKVFVETGSEINLQDYLDWFDEDILKLEGYYKATEVNTYKAKIVLRDYYNYAWSSQTTGDVELFWEIKAKTNTLPYILLTLGLTVVFSGILALVIVLIDPKRKN